MPALVAPATLLTASPPARSAERAAGYLLSLQQVSSGLIRSGPDVSWYSTQHNLLAYSFLELLSSELIAGHKPAALLFGAGG